MAGKKDGYKARLYISENGGTTFYEILGLNNGTPDFSTETEDNRVWENNGNSNPDITGTTNTFSFEGFRITDDDGQNIILRRQALQEPALFKFYEDKTDTSKYIRFQAIISSVSYDNDATAKSTFSFELGAQGKPDAVGY